MYSISEDRKEKTHAGPNRITALGQAAREAMCDPVDLFQVYRTQDRKEGTQVLLKTRPLPPSDESVSLYDNLEDLGTSRSCVINLDFFL